MYIQCYESLEMNFMYKVNYPICTFLRKNFSFCSVKLMNKSQKAFKDNLIFTLYNIFIPFLSISKYSLRLKNYQ